MKTITVELDASGRHTEEWPWGLGQGVGQGRPGVCVRAAQRGNDSVRKRCWKKKFCDYRLKMVLKMSFEHVGIVRICFYENVPILIIFMSWLPFYH